MSVKVSGGVESDVSESLHDDRLSLKSGSESDHVHVLLCIAEDLCPVVNSASRCRHSTMHATLGDGLSRHASRRVQVRRVEFGIFVRHPCHFPLASVHVRRGNVSGGAKKTVLKKFGLNQLEITLIHVTCMIF